MQGGDAVPLTLQDIVEQTRAAGLEISETEVRSYVSENWVFAEVQEDTYYFDEADAARVKLIVELKRDMAVNDEAVPVILNLLDQLYGMREVLEDIGLAVERLPPSLRRELEDCLARVPGKS